jgi:hypothetical protein
MIALDGYLLQTTKTFYPYVNKLRVVEVDKDVVEKMDWIIFINEYYNRVRVTHSLLSSFLDNPKNDILIGNCNVLFMDTMNTLEGNRSTGLFPLYDIESFLLKTNHETVVLSANVCKRCGQALIKDAYKNIEEQYQSFLFNIITYCQFKIVDKKKYSYQREYKSMSMVCFFFVLRKDKSIDFKKVDFHVDKGRYCGYPN